MVLLLFIIARKLHNTKYSLKFQKTDVVAKIKTYL